MVIRKVVNRQQTHDFSTDRLFDLVTQDYLVSWLLYFIPFWLNDFLTLWLFGFMTSWLYYFWVSWFIIDFVTLWLLDFWASCLYRTLWLLILLNFVAFRLFKLSYSRFLYYSTLNSKTFRLLDSLTHWLPDFFS